LSKDLLNAKCFGAQKIFCAKQAGFSDADDSKQQISSLKQAVEGKQEKLRDLRSSLESANARILPLETHVRLVEKTATLSDRIASLEHQLKSIERPDSVEDESAETLELRVKYLDTQVVQRRRMAFRMMAEICEQCGFSRVELAGDLGLDMCYDKSRDA
jgi:chromosome segregation ATPase